MMRSKPYVVTVMTKLLNGTWDKVCYRYSRAEDMIYYAGYYVDLAEQRLQDGEIVDYQVSYPG